MSLYQKKTDLFVTAILILTSIVLVSVIAYKACHRKYSSGRALNKALNDALQNQLNTAPYHPIPSPSTIRNILETNSVIDETQKTQLVSELELMLKAYTEGSLNVCLSFCEPRDIVWAYNTNLFNDIIKSGYANTNTPSEEIVKVILDKDSNRSYYKDYFSGIVFSPDEINAAIGNKNYYGKKNIPGVTIVTTNQLIPLDHALYVLTNYITLGVAESVPLVLVSPTPADILGKYGQIQYANVYWLVKPSDKIEPPDVCFPIVVQLYWNPDGHNWIFSALARCNVWVTLKYKTQLQV